MSASAQPLDSLPARFETLSLARLDDVDRAQVPGLNDFFGAGHTLAQIDAGRAKKLLQAFSAGRWHRRAQVQGEPA